MDDEVITQDRSSGRVHVRIRRNGALYDNPRCNLEGSQAGGYRIITEAELGELPRSARCRNCWPEDDGSTQPIEMVP